MDDFPSLFNTRITGLLFFHQDGLSCAMPSTQVLVETCHHQLMGQIHSCGELLLALQSLGLSTAQQGWSRPLGWISWRCGLDLLLWGHFPVYFHLRWTSWCSVRVFHDGEWWIQGVMGDSAGWVQKGGPGLQRGKQHGMQVTITLHCLFPTLSPFSFPI